MILTPSEMRAAEEDAFANGVQAEALMDRAGERIACAIRRRWPTPGTLVAYLGKGHNAGDALVAAQHLRGCGWSVSLRDAHLPNEGSPLTRKKRVEFLASHRSLSAPSAPLVLLDGLLGIGACGPLRPAIEALAREMNERRAEEGAHVVAIDLPTGLDGETGQAEAHAVRADVTLTIGFAKTGVIADQATACVGALEVIPLPQILPPQVGGDRELEVVTPDVAVGWYRRRPVDHYKNRAGHVAIFAGSLGYTGAAALTAEGALSAGAGLVSLYVSEAIYPVLATRCSPEIMVHPLPNDFSSTFLGKLTADVFALGPGLGTSPSKAYLRWLRKEVRPVVVDADGLNLIARQLDSRQEVASVGPRIFTPHPGEFARLFPEEAALPTRRERAEAVADTFPLTLLYKGARSLVSQVGEPMRMNLTGNPGMATGGMGDVLTGMIAALVAQGYAPSHAASLGAWLAGRAADQALHRGWATQETLRPTMVLRGLTAAFREISGLDGAFILKRSQKS